MSMVLHRREKKVLSVILSVLPSKLESTGGDFLKAKSMR